jgi:hypothetical protein
MRSWLLLVVALVGCEQNIDTGGGGGGLTGSDRPSIVSACSEGLASEPKHPVDDHNRPIIVNVPTQPAPVVNVPDRPTINCTRSSGSATE